jgi:hypothetical protein
MYVVIYSVTFDLTPLDKITISGSAPGSSFLLRRPSGRLGVEWAKGLERVFHLEKPVLYRLVVVDDHVFFLTGGVARWVLDDGGAAAV